MNPIAEEIKSFYGSAALADDNFLEHYGMPRRSGRYPWGSGEDPYQSGRDFLGRIEELKKQGWEETPENIMKEFGLTTRQYRSEKSVAKDERRALQVARAKALKEDGLGDTEIGRQMGVNESTVRSWLDPNSEARMNQAKETAKFIKETLDSKQGDKKIFIDVGSEVYRELNISKEMLDKALYLLEREGYPVYAGRVDQVTNPGKKTTVKVICPPGTKHKEIFDAFQENRIDTLKEYISRDDGESYEKKFHYPESMDSKRLMIRYAEDGGVDRDGLVELRRGVDDLSLGESRYSQVRILVDGKKYIKGMAVYSDDMPDGVDVIFNTNKTREQGYDKALKDIKSDPDNPFGSAIKDAEQGGQYWYTDKKTGERKLGLINKRADEGDWTEWKDALPSQFLSKQTKQLAKRQLDLAASDKMDEFNEICSLTNPTVKKYWLNKFAEECDSAAVHLQAAALPGQKYHVIIPINSIPDNKIYAPRYEDGTKLALVRYPHGGTFEIPILTVDNKNPDAKKILGTTVTDVVGINKRIADRLSGADFDGDTVMCIPTHDKKGKVKITSTPALEGLEGFDPKMSYGTVKKGDDYYNSAGHKIKVMKNTQTEMGIISNLITDMTLKGANTDELAAAVRHSMVVIDAEKHKLDYKQSALDNNISALKKKYQSYVDADGKIHTGGASTLISRASGEMTVTKRQGTPKVNLKGEKWYDPDRPEGALIFKDADDAYYETSKVNKRTGEITTVTKKRTQASTRMAETDDASTLISDMDTPMEKIYAEYANKMKSLANKARVEAAHAGKVAYSKNAKETYSEEVRSLNEKLRIALLNAPRERQAQLRANAEVIAKKKAHEQETGTKMKKADIKKASQLALSKYRREVGSVARRDRSIKITDREWEAIQAGAVSENILKKILNNTDADNLRDRSMPKTRTTVSQTKINRIKAYAASNYTLEQIATKLNLSPTTVSKYLKGVS